MTQITATLGENANPSIIREVLENMKGVLKVTISRYHENINELPEKSSDRMEKLIKLQQKIDLSGIDIKDEKTRYILRGSNLLSELESNRP